MAVKSVTYEDFCNRANTIHDNKYDYSLVKFRVVKDPVQIICPIHGIFESTVDRHVNSKIGCRKCSKLKVTKTTEQFIKEAKEIHGELYDYSLVEYTANNKKVNIICPIHGTFYQTPYIHLRGNSCKKCTNKERSKSLSQFIIEANEVHKHKYNYSNTLYTGINKSITVICDIHGPFYPVAYSHLAGTGCPTCGILTKTKTTEQFIKEAKEIHGELYDYTKVNYINSNTNVTIICYTHGEFDMYPTNHIHKKNGCKQCYIDSRRTDRDSIIQTAKQVHGNRYDYSSFEFDKYKSEMVVICPKHGPFSQDICNHLHGRGCPKCSTYKTYSNVSIRWLEDVMRSEGIFIQHALNQGEYKIPNTKFKVDGYCHETNTVYEFHGDVFHGNPLLFEPDTKCHPKDKNITANELYEQTIAREQSIRNLGYNLMVMWESDYYNKV